MVWFFLRPKKESRPVPQEFHSPLTSLRKTLTHQEHQLFLMVSVSMLSMENSAMRSPVSFISGIIIQFNQMTSTEQNTTLAFAPAAEACRVAGLQPE